MTKVVIHGAAGRMGRRLMALAIEADDMELVGAVDAADSGAIGQDAGELAGVGPSGVIVTDEVPPEGDVVIDFSLPIGTRNALKQCLKHRKALVIGTTGLTDADHTAIDETSHEIAIMQAPNMSLGVNLLFALCGQVAQQLGDEYDIEIVEIHHRFKKDAPSGTALGVAQAICNATGKSMESDVIYGRHGDDVPRERGQIAMHALRSGDVVGRHTASFGSIGEELQLTHIATNRDVFARGALRAAQWLASGKAAGRYRMRDVLGF